MSQIVLAVSDVTPFQEPEGFPNDKRKKQKLYVNAHSFGTSSNTEEARGSIDKQVFLKPCLVCKKQGHNVRECETFADSSLEDRWKYAQELHLCRKCLNAHGRYPCKAAIVFRLNGCQERHHKLLHPRKSQSELSSH